LARLWKYTVFGATSIIGEEANPIGGGIMARHGRADLLAVIAAVALGTWAASMVLYYIGYSRIDWVRKRWPEKERLVEGALQMVARHPWPSALGVRFVFGLRLVLPIACGASRMPLRLYTIASGISCLVWAITFSYLGVAFAGAAVRFLHFTRRLDVQLGAAAIILLIVLAAMIVRRRTSDRGDAELAQKIENAS
jgi:membrane protein DedA with SNARE-associated domain